MTLPMDPVCGSACFVSGCTLHCKDCFNREIWDFGYGTPFTQETIEQILTLLAPDYIRGLTVLGGEPFEPQNQPGVLGFCARSGPGIRRNRFGLLPATPWTAIFWRKSWALGR